MAQAFYTVPPSPSGVLVFNARNVCSITFSSGLGVMLWVTQKLSNLGKQDTTIRSVDVALPPPPPLS